MSRWQKHMLNPGDKSELVGEKVDCMNILEQGDDGKSLRLGCSKCDKVFWFDDAEDGRNAVQRDGEIHAKCPKCGCEWDGDLAHYYEIGFIMPEVPAPFRMLQALLSGQSPANAGKAVHIGIFDAVKADNPQEALSKVTWPKGVPATIRENGLIVRQCSRSVYEQAQHSRGMATISEHAEKNGEDLTNFLKNLLSGRNNGSPTSDPAAKKVMDSMQS